MARDRENVSAFSSSKAFEGFTVEDFAAYEEKKWSSNAYTLARRTAKDKLLIIAHTIESELQEELGSLDLFGSDEAPTIANGRKVEAQWAYFVREPQLRALLKPRLQTTDLGAASLFDIALQSQHIALCIRVDAKGIHVSIDLPTKATVDRENLKVILDSDSARAGLVELCQSLPGETTLGFADDRLDALSIDESNLRAYADQLCSKESLFSISTLITIEDAVEVADALIGTVAQMTAAFLPAYRFMAWSKDNDQIELLKNLKADEKNKQEAHLAAFQVGDRVTILSGLFSGRMGYLHEINDSGKAKVMVGPIAVNVEAKDLKPN